MKVSGIIAEFNPFHKGHLHLLDYARNEMKSDYIVVVMSGDYVQRGAPAILPKRERVKMALLSGADLVLELPFPYSCLSIDYFSKASVYTLNSLSVTDNILFGSECGDINALKHAAKSICTSNVNMSEIRECLKSGNSYAKANAAAFNELTNKLLSSPNNSLGIHYIKALLEINSAINPCTVKRIISNHNDTSAKALSSTSIRSQLINDTYSMNSLHDKMPEASLNILHDYLKTNHVIDENLFSNMLFYKLLEIENESSSINDAVKKLTEYADVSEALAHKILTAYKKSSDFSDLCSRVKSKDLTYTRISRALLHILLSVKTHDVSDYMTNGTVFYSKILGFNKNSTKLINEIKTSSSIPLITKPADYEKDINSFYSDTHDDIKRELASKMFRREINASNLYKKAVCTEYRQPYISEFEQQLILI